jgi:putative serine protease PepD
MSRSTTWVLAGCAALVGGLVGGSVAAAVVTRGSDDRVCRSSEVAGRGLPAVVTIQAQGSTGAGTGSGEVIRGDGHILTNDHVISPAGPAGRITVVFDDGTAVPARTVGRDPLTDLAVLKVDDRPSLPVLTIGSSSGLDVGQPVVVLGAPLGLSSTVTTGVVSALGRTVRVPSDEVGTALLAAAIQTDAAINPGNSGGALVDCSARLVGIPTAGATVPDAQGNSGGGSIGIGFAIPVDSAMRIADELIRDGSVAHSYLGVQVAPVPRSSGLYVQAVTPSSPAAVAGLRVGDVLTAVDGQRVTDVDQLDTLSVTRRSGERVRLTYQRAGRAADVTVTLAGRPSQP